MLCIYVEPYIVGFFSQVSHLMQIESDLHRPRRNRFTLGHVLECCCHPIGEENCSSTFRRVTSGMSQNFQQD